MIKALLPLLKPGKPGEVMLSEGRRCRPRPLGETGSALLLALAHADCMINLFKSTDAPPAEYCDVPMARRVNYGILYAVRDRISPHQVRRVSSCASPRASNSTSAPMMGGRA